MATQIMVKPNNKLVRPKKDSELGRICFLKFKLISRPNVYFPKSKVNWLYFIILIISVNQIVWM